MNQYRETTIAGLHTYIVEGKPGAPVIVILHGYGANGMDLLGLAREIAAPEGTTWYFPDAPISLGFGGLAWFPLVLDTMDFEARKNLDYSEITPLGIDFAREKIFQFLKEINVPLSDIIFGGFSQGSMLSVDVALRLPEKIKALLVLSGTLLNESIWMEFGKTKAGLPFFQSHGTDDPLLPYKAAKNLNLTLTGAGLKGDFITFNGGHGIPLEVILKLDDFIAKL